MKIFTQSVHILYRNRERKCAAAFEYISCFLRNVWLLLRIFYFILRNVRLLLKDINVRLLLKENVQLFFWCVAGSRNISMFFKRTCGCFWKDINDCFWNLLKEKNVRLLLGIMSLNKYFEVKIAQNKDDGNIFFASETHCFSVFLVELL